MVTKKTYTISLEEKDGLTNMNRVNDGFNAFELLAILEIAKADILNQIKDDKSSEIDFIKRQIVED